MLEAGVSDKVSGRLGWKEQAEKDIVKVALRMRLRVTRDRLR